MRNQAEIIINTIILWRDSMANLPAWRIDHFKPNIYAQVSLIRIGLDFISVKYESPGGKSIPVKIWDTAGQERFKTITYSFYRQAQGVLICYDVTNRESFENVKNWIDSIDNHAKPNIQKVLIGNKIDLIDDRKITKEEAQNLADEHNIPYFETSAKLDKNVSEVIHFIMDKVYETTVKAAKENQKEEIRGSQLTPVQPVEDKDECKC